MSIPTRSIAAFTAGALVTALAVAAAHTVPVGAIGEDEATFVPIEPCRLFDTRPAGVGTRNTPIGADSSHDFQVTGSNGECTIPSAATAVSINLTAVGATTPTNLRMYPSGSSVPNAAVLNVRPGQGPTPNKLDVKLSSDGRVAVYNRFGTVDVIGDVMGYYRRDGLEDLESRVAALEAVQPFAVSARTDEVTLGQLGGSAGTIVSLDVTPPADGQLTVNSTTHIDTTDIVSGAAPPWTPASCSITTGSALDTAYVQALKGEVGDLDSNQLAGTRVIEVAGGVATTVRLWCEHDTLFTLSYFRDSVLTAVFTPGG